MFALVVLENSLLTNWVKMSNSEKQLVIEDTKERKKEFLKSCLILVGRVKILAESKL